MQKSNRPRSGSAPVEQNRDVASAFSPIDPGDSAFNRLSPEVVMRKGRMGDAYIKANKLTAEEVDQIIQLQNRLHIRFGEAAVRLGLLTEEEVKEVLDKQFNYGSVGTEGQASKISRSLAIVHAQTSEAAEAIRRLRSQLLVRVGEEAGVAIAVLSPLKGEGKSYIAASLAIAFAQLSIRTMLIDANLRAPVQHKLFGLSSQTGVSTVLAKRSASTLDAVPRVMPHLWVMGSGPLPPNPLEILSSPNLTGLLNSFAEEITVFIVDTPSTMQWADAQTIARQTGRAVLVGRENMTRLADLKKAASDMVVAGVDILGTVYNQPSKSPGSGMGGGFWRMLLAPFASLLDRLRGRGGA